MNKRHNAVYSTPFMATNMFVILRAANAYNIFITFCNTCKSGRYKTLKQYETHYVLYL